MCRRMYYLIFIVLTLGLVAGVAGGVDIKVNFMQQGDPPEGYLPDYGLPFGPQGDSPFNYGWDRDIAVDARTRGSANAPDERYDTIIHLQKGTPAVWEIEVPNGNYNVFLVCGDPGYTDQLNNMDVEGVIAEDPDGMAGAGFDFDEWELIAVVSDGRLTIQPAADAGNSKIAFVDIMGVTLLKAYGPTPQDEALYTDTWVNLSWSPGDFAVSHDMYLGDNFDDVNNGTGDTFRGNTDSLYFVAGFPGFPYPDGLVPGTTYYWRIDEVNEAEPNSPWKGEVWSFSIPPKTAYNPAPSDGAELIDANIKLSWTAGFDAKLHTIYFSDNFDDVNDGIGGLPQGEATYNPGPLKLAKTYYWRVDEFDAPTTYKGDVWTFTTQGAVSGANPANGAMDVKPSVVLSWDAGTVAASHELYFGTDADAVKNATTASPEYKGPKALGEESYDPGMLAMNTAYYWRIDEVNAASADSPWVGNVWSFTTGNFFSIDDFEDYDASDNQIWYTWHDGLGYGIPGTADYFAGNGSGAAVGDETTASYTEETIVHGGGKSMPVAYDNNKQGFAYYSEVERTLTAHRDWTEKGFTELSLWFYGDLNNSAEPLYVAVSNSTGTPAVILYNNPAAATFDKWTPWIIPLQDIADKGINLTNVDRIAIGLGTQGNTTVPGGLGKMYFDDIRLNQP